MRLEKGGNRSRKGSLSQSFYSNSISSSEAPEGTVGYTFSSRSTMTSMMAVFGLANAVRSVDSRSSSLATR